MGNLWGWTTGQGVGEALQGSSCPSGGQGQRDLTVAYGLSLSLEPSPGPCGQPFLSQEGHPRPSLARPHLRLRSRPREGLRAPMHSLPWFLRLPSSVGPARPPAAVPDPNGRPNPSSILGHQPGDLSSPNIFLRPRIGSQPPGGLGHSSLTPFRSPLLPWPIHNPPQASQAALHPSPSLEVSRLRTFVATTASAWMPFP